MGGIDFHADTLFEQEGYPAGTFSCCSWHWRNSGRLYLEHNERYGDAADVVCLCGENNRRPDVRQDWGHAHRYGFDHSSHFVDRVLLKVDHSVADRTIPSQSVHACDALALVPGHAGFAGVCLRTRRIGALAWDARWKDDDEPSHVGLCVGQLYVWPGGDCLLRKEDSVSEMSNNIENCECAKRPATNQIRR